MEHITEERVRAWGVTPRLLGWMGEFLSNFEIPVNYDDRLHVRVESYGVLDAGVLAQVFSQIFEEIAGDPTLLLNDPGIGGTSYYLTAAMWLCGDEPPFTDDWLYWLCLRALNTPPAEPCESEVKHFRLSYEARIHGRWCPAMVVMSAQEIDQYGARLAEIAGAVRSIAVHDGGKNVTSDFACFAR